MTDLKFDHHRLLCRGGPFNGSYMAVMLRSSQSTIDIPDDRRGQQWRYAVEANEGKPIYLQYVGPV